MTLRPGRTRSTRIFLLVAALAHLLGAELGAWVHRAPAGGGAATVFAPEAGREGAPAPAHPLDCAACRTISDDGHALPERGIALRAGIAEVRFPTAPRTAPRFLAVPPSLPRGPPTHS